MEDELVEVMKERYIGSGFKYFIGRVIASAWYQLKILLTYRTQLAIEIIDIVISTLIYYFVSFLVSPEDLVKLGYSPDYLAFAISGIALSRYIWTSVGRLAHKMQHEINSGTFESLASADLDSFRGWIMGQVFYGFTWSSSTFFGSLLIGFALGAGFRVDPIVWIQALFIVFIVVAIHSAIGVMAAGMYIKYKQLETLMVLMTAVIEFFGGVLYPLSLLYNYPILYYISIVIPFTHGLEIFRRIIIDGATITSPQLLFHLGALVLYLPLILLSLKVYERYLNIAKKEGLLSTY